MSDFQELWNEKPWWKEGTTDKEMAEFYYKKGLKAKTAPVAEVPCSDGLSALIDELLKTAASYGKKGSLKNTYSNGQNDGRSLAYIDSANRIKLLIKKSR